MGNSSSTSRQDGPSKAQLTKNLASAEQTGILNLANQDLKASSQVWAKLETQGLIVKLKALEISGNTLKYLPWEILNMVLLKDLRASRCNIQRTYDMSALPSLTALYLDDNDLEADSLAALPPQLRHLNLSNNHCVTVPHGGIAGLLALTELDLSGNRLESVEGLGILVALIDLRLDGNRLTEVSIDLCLCAKLKRLSLKNNKLQSEGASGNQSIPAAVFTETQLEEVLLDGNPSITRAIICAFDGVEVFSERRRLVRDRNHDNSARTHLFGNLQ
jgi:Leucine-rich repeat (LRR) protein